MFTRLFLIVACLFVCARLTAQETKSELDAGAATTAAIRVDIEAKVGGHDAYYGFQVKNSADTGVFTVRGDGSVGIGNVTPAAMLHVSGKDGLLVTGILEMFYYIPTPAQAAVSVEVITSLVPFGALIRNLHFWSAQALLIVVSVSLDLVQKIEANLLMRSYEGFTSSGRIKGAYT